MDTLMNTLIKCGANDQQLNAIHQHLAPLQIDTICDRSVLILESVYQHVYEAEGQVLR